MKDTCKKIKNIYLVLLATAFIMPSFAAGYLYVRNTALEKDVSSVCNRIDHIDQEALLHAAITIVTEGKPDKYEEALGSTKLPYVMQEIEERLASLSSKNTSAVDLIYVRQVAQGFKDIKKRCTTIHRGY